MEVFLIKLAQLILALSILILLHEGGHFFFAKLFGVRVEKFYMFFDWKFSLFKYKPKNSDTEYGLGWIPLGGYCKISGMIDESFDTEQMKRPAQPWEFRTKPAWQRLLIMIGGVLVNFLLALFIYSMILFHWGDTYVPVKDMTLGMKFNQEAKSYGFKDGDILVGTDKGAFKNFSADMYRDISEAQRVDIIRNGKEMSIQMPGELNMLNMLKAQPTFVQPLIPNQVDSVMPGSTADKMGLKKGHRITGIDGKAVASFNEFTDQLCSFYGLESPLPLTITKNYSLDTLTFNDHKLSQGSYQGRYFKGHPINLKAVPTEDSIITGWLINQDNTKTTVAGAELNWMMPDCNNLTIEPICKLKGDFDNNGIVDQADVDLLVSAIMSNTTSGGTTEYDLNNDKKVNAADLVKLVSIVNK